MAKREITGKIDAITKIPTTHLDTVIPPPKSVKIELSPRCNYRCGFCALVTREEQPTKDMDINLFKRITREMREAGVEEIGFFYLGESFMNVPLLVEAVEWCKGLDFPYLFLTTNGSLATPDAVDKVMAAGLDSLKFSVNSPTLEMFEEVIAVSGKNFHKSLANIAEARWVRDEKGYECAIYASSIKYDGEQQDRMEETLKKHVYPFVDQHYWLPLYSMGSYATAREEELGFKPTAGNQGRIGGLVDPLPCWSVFTEGHVRSDGGLSACCFDAHGTWQMADLTQVSFKEAWNSPMFQELRAVHLKKDVTGTICENCVAYK